MPPVPFPVTSQPVIVTGPVRPDARVIPYDCCGPEFRPPTNRQPDTTTLDDAVSTSIPGWVFVPAAELS